MSAANQNRLFGHGDVAHARRLQKGLASDNEAIFGDDMAMDIGWTMISAFLVFLMQAGFSLVEAGYCQYKNMQSIVMKNVLDACVGAFGWY